MSQAVGFQGLTGGTNGAIGIPILRGTLFQVTANALVTVVNRLNPILLANLTDKIACYALHGSRIMAKAIIGMTADQGIRYTATSSGALMIASRCRSAFLIGTGFRIMFLLPCFLIYRTLAARTRNTGIICAAGVLGMQAGYSIAALVMLRMATFLLRHSGPIGAIIGWVRVMLTGSILRLCSYG